FPDHPTPAWTQHWQNRITDLIDQYAPDLLYTDGGLPFGRTGLEMVAHFYNSSLRRNGVLDAVYALKDPSRHDGNHGEYQEGFATLDVERGVIGEASPTPWQTDTCLGGWFYDSRRVYKSPDVVIHMLADIVSKNGCLLLNATQRPDGSLDEKSEWTLQEIGRWLAVNGEAIYETRPWSRFGEGPTTFAASSFAEREERVFTGDDFRFTVKGDTVYAIAMGWPTKGGWLIGSLAHVPVQSVSVLGAGQTKWQATPDGLWVEAPQRLPGDYAWAIRVD
ncbi:MAG: hypothetical protein HOH74_29615, partial [Gemmatimonadetes bacterium]|nr:hypothetical protein [Gemmatimonadota bacterium]